MERTDSKHRPKLPVPHGHVHRDASQYSAPLDGKIVRMMNKAHVTVYDFTAKLAASGVTDSLGELIDIVPLGERVH